MNEEIAKIGDSFYIDPVGWGTIVAIESCPQIGDNWIRYLVYLKEEYYKKADPLVKKIHDIQKGLYYHTVLKTICKE